MATTPIKDMPQLLDALAQITPEQFAQMKISLEKFSTSQEVKELESRIEGLQEDPTESNKKEATELTQQMYALFTKNAIAPLNSIYSAIEEQDTLLMTALEKRLGKNNFGADAIQKVWQEELARNTDKLGPKLFVNMAFFSELLVPAIYIIPISARVGRVANIESHLEQAHEHVMGVTDLKEAKNTFEEEMQKEIAVSKTRRTPLDNVRVTELEMEIAQRTMERNRQIDLAKEPLHAAKQALAEKVDKLVTAKQVSAERIDKFVAPKNSRPHFFNKFLSLFKWKSSEKINMAQKNSNKPKF